MGYESHKRQWMLPGESVIDSGSLQGLQGAGQCAACTTVIDPDLEPGGDANILGGQYLCTRAGPTLLIANAMPSKPMSREIA
jgi:hypothetical protein